MNKRNLTLAIAFTILLVTPTVFAQSYQSWQKQQNANAEENRLLDKIKDNPNDISGYIRLGNYYKDKAQYDLAVSYFGKAIDIDPKDLSGYKSCSETYLKAGRLNDAIAIMEKANLILPNDYDVIITLAPLYSIGKYYDKVINIYNKGIEASKEKRALLRVKLAEFYEKNERYTEAASEYDLIASENPDLLHFKEKAETVRKKESSDTQSQRNGMEKKGIEQDASYLIERNEDGADGEKIYIIKNQRLKVAALIYRSYYADLTMDYPENLKNYSIRKVNIKTHDFEKESKDIFNRYGYRIGKDAFGGLTIVPRNFGDKVLYPKEIEAPIRQSILKELLKNSCSVVDISPVKQSVDMLKLPDIIGRYRTEQNIDAFFIFCYQLYSRVTQRSYSGTTLQVYDECGLMCEYRILLIDSKNMKNIFDEKGRVWAWIPRTEKQQLLGSKMQFQAPVDWVKNTGKKKEGIINGEWLENKMLESLKSTKPILISGSDKIVMMEVQPLPVKLNHYFNKYLEERKISN